MNGPGIHLLVDGLTRMSFTHLYLVKFLEDLVTMVGMQVILGPYVEEQPKGWQGWAVLAESHTAIHVSGKEVHVDLFSCQSYDTEGPMAFILMRLKMTNVRFQVIERPMPLPQGGGE